MGKAWLINLSLLAIVLLLVSVFEPGLHEETSVATVPLSTLSADAVHHIRIEYPDQTPVVLEKDGYWRITSPLRLAANDFKIKSLLEILSTESQARLDSTDLNLAEFGLDPPQAVLEVDGVRFAFGATAPLDAQRYVKTGDTVHVIGDVFYKLSSQAVAFVHLSPLGEKPQISAIQTPYYHIQRQADLWTTVGEKTEDNTPPPRALREAAEAWASAQAFHVRAYEAPDTPPSRIVKIHLQGQEEAVQFEIRQLVPQLILANAAHGVMYELPVKQVAPLIRLQPAPDTSVNPDS